MRRSYIKVNRRLKNGGKFMIAVEKSERYCSVRKSLIESCKEVKLMREGKKEKASIKSLWDNIEQWKKEIEE